MAIVGLLAAVLTPSITEPRRRAHDLEALKCGDAIRIAQKLHEQTRGRYAERLSDLAPSAANICRNVEVRAGTTPPAAGDTGTGLLTATASSYAFTAWSRQGSRAYTTLVPGPVNTPHPF